MNVIEGQPIKAPSKQISPRQSGPFMSGDDVITAAELRNAIEAQCEVEDGSVAGYITVKGVLDLTELAGVINYLTRHPARPSDDSTLTEPPADSQFTGRNTRQNKGIRT
ncbi:hypothetical protein [Mycolicibacterium goodii]|uniref:hypothetical protein n=1 Tax=Mycolicibacterium goodii TaxID=134601 RepID=UPI001BDDC70C|nr:hypothetical protein [Mycolicibacterium goodii]MBU8839110.1 hypothetical protein [Mycolicibacterium goodii]